ncbi:hypothetical protein BGZ76_003034 [Entomortierella beljakovae]|nr:hypothetical protein BGZ76_003034 [Entomortierella beljakovae]
MSSNDDSSVEVSSQVLQDDLSMESSVDHVAVLTSGAACPKHWLELDMAPVKQVTWDVLVLGADMVDMKCGG